MTKRNFQLKLVSYLDSVKTNNPENMVIDTVEKLTDDLGDEHTFKIFEIAASTTDEQIDFGFTAGKVIFLKNLSTSIPAKIKINGASSTEYSIAPGKFLYLESENAAGVGLLDSLYMTNSDSESAISLKLFVSK